MARKKRDKQEENAVSFQVHILALPVVIHSSLPPFCFLMFLFVFFFGPGQDESGNMEEALGCHCDGLSGSYLV